MANQIIRMKEIRRKLLNQPYKKIGFTTAAGADDLSSNLDDYLHASDSIQFLLKIKSLLDW